MIASKQLVAVTIPVYKTEISRSESMSLLKGIEVLKSHPIIFFAPYNLDTSFYEEFCKDKVDFRVERFSDEYFAGIAGYNKLMLSPDFYKRFAGYEYILIYQLDALVFRDELVSWCEKGYDFIGAPYLFCNLDDYPIRVFSRFRKLLKFLNRTGLLNHRFSHVGNGGLSLRKVSRTIFFLNLFKRSKDRWIHNEDSFFTHYGNLVFPFFKIAPEKEALAFSFEEQPERCYALNNNTLPFGCHGFMKYNSEFWQNFITV